MNAHAWKLLAALAVSALAIPCGATEVRPTGLMLWDLVGPPVGGFGTLGPIDYDNTRTGIEIGGSAQTCLRVPVSAQDPIYQSKTVKKFRRTYAPGDAAGDAGTVATFDYQFESPPFDIATMTTLPTYYGEDGIALPYNVIPPGSPDPTNPMYVPCNQFPYSQRFSMGIATSGKTRAVVISEAMTGFYRPYTPPCQTPPCTVPAMVNVGVFYLGVFDPGTGAKLWEKTWPAVDADGWAVATGRSVVAEVLGKKGGDYVRIVQQKTVGGVAYFKAVVYGLATGAEVQTTTFSLPVPQ